MTAGCFDGDEDTFTPFMADQDAVRERAEQAVINVLREEVPQLEEVIRSMKDWNHSGFDCFLGRRIGSNEQGGINRLTCYILRPPFTLGSIQVDQVNGKFRYNSRHANKECPPLDPLELMARIYVHITDKYKHTVFRYGIYSNAAVGKEKKESSKWGTGRFRWKLRVGPADEEGLECRSTGVSTVWKGDGHHRVCHRPG